MKIEYGGRAWDIDILAVPVTQCEAVEKYTNAKGMGDWSNMLDAGNTKAVVALWWLMRKQAGEATGSISQPGDDFMPLALLAAYADASNAEVAAALAAAEAAAEAEAGPDPTAPAGSSPGSAATTTTPAGAAPAPSLPG